MLNGIDPIIIFNFKKALPSLTASVSGIPVAGSALSQILLPAVPIYLSESLTGILIESEDKNVDIETSTETVVTGDAPIQNQRSISSTVKVTMQAKKDAIGLTLFSAMADFIFPKVTSKEYSITYLHGAVTVFDGLLHSFSISQVSNTDLHTITIELVRPGLASKAPIPVVGKVTGALPL